MAPKKSAAAAASAAATGEEDKGPMLKLVVEKGPSSGRTCDFRPGSMVNIGRLVRGNNIAIKDSGISSKHLLIQFDAASDPDRRRWTITDLDSSNGTVLNGAQLEPAEPVALSDGDVIKIGEETSITVKLEVGGVENEAGSVNLRRNARRRVREKAADLVVIDEDAEQGLQNREGEEKVAEIEAKQGRNVSTRRTRNSAKNENLAKDLGSSGIEGSLRVSTRRTRSSRKEETVDEIAVDLSVVEGKKTMGGGRGRKKLPVETISKENEKEESNPDLKTCEEEKERSEVGVDELGIKVNNSGRECVAAGFTRNPRKEENVDEIGVDLSVIEGKKTREGGRGTISEETEKEDLNPDHKTCEEEKGRSEVRVDESAIEVNNSGREGVAAKRRMVPDLEKLTLGEWLDFLDVHEPQDIVDKTEEMLAEMRRKAERCHEFMLQQKKSRG